MLPIGAFFALALLVELSTASPDFAARNFFGESASDSSSPGGGVNSKAPMSGARPWTRAPPARSSGPSSPGAPASIVGEPGASPNSPF